MRSSAERVLRAITPDTNPDQSEPAAFVAENQKDLSVAETRDAVSYLGVRLEKAENAQSQFVPRREQYADFINDRDLALPLQRDIAVAWLNGEPMLVEGGTSLGKTTTVRKMCAELGYEVHYVNINGASDVEDLMGRYVPNAHRHSTEEPEYVFADGKVTSGLRQETGKKKVIILDEFNAAKPNILIRLHEVLDALERGGNVILSEDASEAVPTDKAATKIIALMNPPGKGYFGREPLDPAQLRRWVYKKLPGELPAETFSHATDALFGLADAEQDTVEQKAYLSAREQALPASELKDIPGIQEIVAKYKEFHAAAKAMLKNRTIAEDQPQPFFYDDRMEPRRVMDFVLRFYHGDITETFQQALRYYYANKLETDLDRKKLEELIKLVEYKPKSGETKRKGLETERKQKAQLMREIEQLQREIETDGRAPDGERTGETATERAQEVMGDNFFGKLSIEKTFGFEIPDHEIPPIPYTEAQLEKAKELGEMLVLRISHDSAGNIMTMKRIHEITTPRLAAAKDGKLLYNPGDWYKDESFFSSESLKTEWKLVGTSFVPKSTAINYIEQTRKLRDYLASIGSLSTDDLKGCSDEDLNNITETMTTDWKAAAKKLSELAINRNHRRSPAEILYDWVVRYQNIVEDRRGILENKYDWSNRLTSGGGLVHVGSVDATGA